MQETAVVVGVGPGLGAVLVRRLASEGFRVHAAARDVAKLESLAGESEGRVVAERCDATSADEVSALFERVGAAGPPSLVIYNVGTLARGEVATLDPEVFSAAWRTITLGGFLVGQAAARLMLPAGRGTILYTGATSALRGRAGFAAPAAARAGLRALAQSMARELGPQGIHVAHVVIDGGIWRPEYADDPRFAERLRQAPPDSLLSPEAIAEAYLALHRQTRSAWTQELDLRPWVEKF